ncbi:MAG: hypothetical protein GX146_12830 [Myxococcales bacterium]|nr:hypothetical protein [Myxococcales bacterium]
MRRIPRTSSTSALSSLITLSTSLITLSACLFLITLSACRSAPSDAPGLASTPTDVAWALLELHGLKGRLPEDRPRDVVDRLVPREKLQPLFLDLDEFDPFIGDLYVGVIVGALARHQDRLFASASREDATLTAGQSVIHLRKDQGGWKVHLEKSIPEEMKARAQAEKARYENARVP